MSVRNVICPECGSELCQQFVWSNGAVTTDCHACDYFDVVPPAPVIL